MGSPDSPASPTDLNSCPQVRGFSLRDSVFMTSWFVSDIIRPNNGTSRESFLQQCRKNPVPEYETPSHLSLKSDVPKPIAQRSRDPRFKVYSCDGLRLHFSRGDWPVFGAARNQEGPENLVADSVCATSRPIALNRVY